MKWLAGRIIVAVLGCTLLAACEQQAPPIPTAMQVPPTATGTPEPTSTDTPEATATNTPTPEAPQAISNFVDDLPGEFSFTWSQQTKSWDINHHLTVQLTETENRTTDQTVARFSADGTQMTINVKGEDIQLPVTNFGQSADQSRAESGSYQLIPGADVKTGIGFNLGIKDTVDGRVAYGYNVWGWWVEYADYRVGNLVVNDFDMFVGALRINPERADYFYEQVVKGIYNIQVVTDNYAVLNRYPTPDAFIAAARTGMEFTYLNIPKYYPGTTVLNRYANRVATIEQVERMRLDTVQIGFQEQSYDRILHPTDPYRSFFSFFYDSYLGTLADVKVRMPDTGGVSSLDLTFGRLKQINPFGCFGTMQVETSQDQLAGAASQLAEMWLYATNSSGIIFAEDSPFLSSPLLNLYSPLNNLYKTDPNYACPWAESDLVLTNK